MNKRFFLPVAIDYPSSKPHIGHCLEKIQADVIARYKRLQGFEVHFSVGTDEHGQKIERCAQTVKKEPKVFVAETSKYFKDLWKALDISNDDFIRTTEKRHEKVVQKIIKKIHAKGDIYKGKYKGLHCVDCETYYLAKDLDRNLCPVHHKSVEAMEEETYFFRMSGYQSQLLKYINENKSFIIPENRRKEILARLESPIHDLNIARKAVRWGIPFPLDKSFTCFVWLEALLNYLTTIDYPNGKFKKFWPGTHVIGKDIIWHHAVIFPCLLLSAGLKLPKQVLVHGFITVNGQKMSKSLGNVVDPFELIKKYGADPVRYFLLREIPPTEDGDFTYEKFEKRYNADLAKGLGNLVARVVTLAQKSEIQNPKSETNSKFKIQIQKTKKEYVKFLDEFRFNEALASIWELISFCDKCVEEEKVWEGGKEEVIGNLLYTISQIAELLQPFLPETAEKILKQLKERKGEPLFPRI